MLRIPLSTILRAFSRQPKGRTSKPRTIAIVGNGKVDRKSSAVIDAADIVVRFNRASNYGGAGKRTDVLVVVNWSHPGEEFAKSPKLINSTVRRTAKEFLLTADPTELPSFLNGRPRLDGCPPDYTAEILRSVVQRRPYSFIPMSRLVATEHALISHGARKDVIPSSGALVIDYFHDQYPDAAIHLFGFSHSGWNGHCWDAERRWIETVLANNDRSNIR
ncbi:hypothetical protein M2281_000167 [Mesorhizobium soli]|nr:hypothetical protein [Mesorhizobium soli]